MLDGYNGNSTVEVHPTQRFAVLERRKKSSFPVVALEDLLLHKQRELTDHVRHILKNALIEYGFCLISVSHGRPAAILKKLCDSAHAEIFPDDDNATRLQTSSTTYVSEKGIPMYKLGYEKTEDGVREIFRMAAGQPKAVTWPSPRIQNTWSTGLGLMRHVTDTALDLLIATAGNKRIKKRVNSGSSAWQNDVDLRERPGDFSLLYVMHYFNNSTATLPEHGIAVKPHVDPSLLVLEPFLCPYTRGLQVWDRTKNTWMDCDGPNSEIVCSFGKVMLLFAGKGLQDAVPEIQPTSHRVVAGDRPRRTVIYEQKYEEFFLRRLLTEKCCKIVRGQ